MDKVLSFLSPRTQYQIHAYSTHNPAAYRYPYETHGLRHPCIFYEVYVSVAGSDVTAGNLQFNRQLPDPTSPPAIHFSFTICRI